MESARSKESEIGDETFYEPEFDKLICGIRTAVI